MGGESVEVKQYGNVVGLTASDKANTKEQLKETTSFDPSTWPDGQHFVQMLQSEGITKDDHPYVDKADYWQLSARWALLSKFVPDLLSKQPTKKRHDTKSNIPNAFASNTYLEFDDDLKQEIQTIWQQQINLANNDQEKSNENKNSHPNDLMEFLQQGFSNHRSLQWSTMRCPPSTQFRLHAHPNLELIYCARGALHEVRMSGPPLSNVPSTTTTTNETNELPGPNLTDLKRPWHFATLSQNSWLVNEVMSIHKSFTASVGDGCILIVLWGGSHANVTENQEPSSVHIQNAVDTMDGRLQSIAKKTLPNMDDNGNEAGACSCVLQQWERLEETFLPESERQLRDANGDEQNDAKRPKIEQDG